MFPTKFWLSVRPSQRDTYVMSLDPNSISRMDPKYDRVNIR